MTTLPTTPFPELHALDRKRSLPSLAELLSGGSSLPVPVIEQSPPPRSRTPLSGLARLPDGDTPSSERKPAPRSVREMPVGAAAEMVRQVARSMEDAADTKALRQEEFAMPHPPQVEPAAPATRFSSPAPARSERPATSTDDELKDALLPLLETTLAKALYAPETGIHTYLEPMLRSTVRRAIAEQMDTARQFSEVGTIDRLAWRLSALFSSRSYDEVVFERTRRFQVEEVYLIRKGDKSLISYASHDPARHASTRRVQSTLQVLLRKLKEAAAEHQTTFELPEKRLGLIRAGRFCILLAILRGRSNALVRADLDYVLRQAEERFGERLDRSSEAFLHVLQPILEGCLLIQSPAPPR